MSSILELCSKTSSRDLDSDIDLDNDNGALEGLISEGLKNSTERVQCYK
jgi:hypothetical protein